jgi:putative AdoMet-dependent methyltransferase
VSEQEEIKSIPVWQWDEMRQVGTDYADVAEVENYDKRMGTFRDITAENQKILQTLNMPVVADFLEIGCGTGRLALAAAEAGHCVTAVDISAVMLRYVAQKAAGKGLSVRLQNAGFLTMNLPSEYFDAVVTSAAMHHLPDVWKLVALRNIHRCLKPGGQFILRDVIFTLSGEQSVQNCLETFIQSFPSEVQPGAVGHAACEYSTFDWIMDGLLARAGFRIISKFQEQCSFWNYHCRKL